MCKKFLIELIRQFIQYYEFLQTDDFGVFDTSLSKEMLICAKAFDLNRKELYNLSLNAIEYSFASATEKSALKSKLAEFEMRTFKL